ncbi:MAG: hypothetical protein R6U13_16495 [Desulfatiglandaceae bacterium]
MLEREGWHVYYLGANTPAPDVTEIIEKQGADICAVSVAVSFNEKYQLWAIRECRMGID